MTESEAKTAPPAAECVPRFAGIALDATLLVTTLATALLFVAGWGYAEQWLGSFDLGVIGLGIPSGYFALYGYWVATANLWWLVPFVALGAPPTPGPVLGAAARGDPRRGPRRRPGPAAGPDPVPLLGRLCPGSADGGRQLRPA
jgi:hypothetical protein